MSTRLLHTKFLQKFKFLVEEEKKKNITVRADDGGVHAIDDSKIVSPEKIKIQVESIKNTLKQEYYIANKETAIMKDNLNHSVASSVNRFFNCKEYTVSENNFNDDQLMIKTDLNLLEAEKIINDHGPKFVESVTIAPIIRKLDIKTIRRKKTRLGRDHFELTITTTASTTTASMTEALNSQNKKIKLSAKDNVHIGNLTTTLEEFLIKYYENFVNAGDTTDRFFFKSSLKLLSTVNISRSKYHPRLESMISRFKAVLHILVMSHDEVIVDGTTAEVAKKAAPKKLFMDKLKSVLGTKCHMNNFLGTIPFIPTKEIKNMVFPIVQIMGFDVHVYTLLLASRGVCILQFHASRPTMTY